MSNAPAPLPAAPVPALFRPIRLRELEIRNRIWIPPMCQYSVDTLDGVPGDWHLVHYGALARGGAGLVIAEATAVLPDGRITDRDTGLWDDAQTEAWRRIVGIAHGHGAAMGVQLAHAGRKASTWPALPGRPHGTQPVEEGGWTAVAPSAVAFDGYAEPEALDRAGIAAVVEAFRAAARRAADAGFDLVELHAAHGYLLHEFLSPLSNRRDDEWGGSLEGRARLLLEVVRAVRAEVGERMPVLVRFSATDWAAGGWDVESTSEVARWAIEAGADAFDVSTGGLVAHQAITLGPGYQLPHAIAVREATGAPVAAVGLITTPAHAESIVAAGLADAVLVGRPALRDPHWPLRAAHELGADDAAAWPGDRKSTG
ncbi:NADH:flavin oxidoreductase/NADH oxidase, partial [Agromyces seonyuensis]